MPRRNARPLPNLPISLEALPPPEPKRTSRVMVSFTETELEMIEKAAKARNEQPAVLCRTIILTAFQNSAIKALNTQPTLLSMSPREQQKALLDAFSVD